MPSFADSIFLFVLALLLFGPKKLPVLARELGKWVGEFRRASNEFKMQMEDELRASEQAERQKQIASMEAAAPIPPPLGEPEEEHPHLRPSRSVKATPPPLTEPLQEGAGDGSFPKSSDLTQSSHPAANDSGSSAVKAHQEMHDEITDSAHPLPIATSGELQMNPPATGLPTPRRRGANPLGGCLLDAIPESNLESNQPLRQKAGQTIGQETTAHGD